MKTILVLPVYNEGKYIDQLILEAKKYVDEVITVDDGSKDKSFEKTKQAGAIALKHKINLGKAAALKTGAEAALLREADIIIFMDSDGQHLASDLPRFIEPIKKDKIDIVIGGRVGGDKMPFLRKYGNKTLGIMTRILFKIDVRDIQSGYRAFKAQHYNYLCWNSKNYHADAEMTVRAGKYGLKYKEIDIATIYKDRYKGMDMIDGIKLLFNILKWRVFL